MIRALVAEDSATTRTLLVEILSSDPELVVVAQACDGREAVEFTRRLRPDVVTMDLQMPRLDGLRATREIMAATPTPIVIVTNSLRAREVVKSLEALRAGALDVLVKPPGPGAPGFSESAARLVSTVKAMAHVKVIRHWLPPAPAETRRPGPAVKLRAVAIAASTGGPAALRRLLAAMPAEFPAPVLVVQHIAVGFAAGLASWLGSSTPLRVKLAEDGEPLAARTVYLAPDDHHLTVVNRGEIRLDRSPPVGGFRPSADSLLSSMARVGPAAAGVILTGMGRDGVAGLRTLHECGGLILAQDEATSAVFGMPAAAVEAGLVDALLSPEAIAVRLCELS